MKAGDALVGLAPFREQLAQALWEQAEPILAQAGEQGGALASGVITDLQQSAVTIVGLQAEATLAGRDDLLEEIHDQWDLVLERNAIRLDANQAQAMRLVLGLTGSVVGVLSTLSHNVALAWIAEITQRAAAALEPDSA